MLEIDIAISIVGVGDLIVQSSDCRWLFFIDWSHSFARKRRMSFGNELSVLSTIPSPPKIPTFQSLECVNLELEDKKKKCIH